MLKTSANFAWAFGVIAVLCGIAVFCAERSISNALRTRKAVFVWSAVAAAIVCAEYLFGPWSFLYWDDEGAVANPMYAYAATRVLPGQRFAPEFAGGSDLYGMLASGMQYVSFEVILSGFLPQWAVMAVHKIYIFAFGFSGTYLLCRRGVGADRPTAFAIGLLFVVIDYYHFRQTMTHGVGWTFLPLAIYLAVCRIAKPNYWWGVVATAALGMTVTPTHAFLPLIVGVVSGAGMLAPRWSLKPIGAAAAITLAVLANWHEVLFAFSQLAPLAERGSALREIDLATAVLSAIHPLGSMLGGWIFVVSLAALGLFRDPLFARGLLAYGIFWLCGFVMFGFPWHWIGLAELRGVSVGTYAFALNALAMPLAARAITRIGIWNIDKTGMARIIKPGALALATAAGLLVFNKGIHIFHLVHHAGINQLSTIDNLRQPSWKPESPSRVVTMRSWQPEPNIVSGVYGLEAFDGTLDLPLRVMTDFWNQGIMRDARRSFNFPHFIMDYTFWSFDRLEYALARHVSLKHLRIANVEFVITSVPVAETNGIRLVSGPDFDKALHGTISDWKGKLRYYRWRLQKIRHFGNAYVYRIGDPLPRLFGAARVEVVPDDTDIAALAAKTGQFALDRTIVVRNRDASRLPFRAPSVAVKSFDRSTDAYNVSIDAPDGGILVLNVPPSPFWIASVDGWKTPIVPSNMIHMVVSVPPGSRTVEFRYARPLLREKFVAFVSAIGK